ncbi:uncharacterized protein [Miscanthus floridulus]|uniref:uncharacterized protein isoform X4 n=1 Tax=Miscanthus floridulus TaxID=154761 RepID=UPI00345997B7
MVSLNRLMFKKGRRRRRRIQSSNGLIAPVPQKDSLCQEDCHLRSGESLTYSGPNFPEDIWFHIHSLLPLRDSVHFACVSRTFMCFWKCHPKLIFTEEALGLKRNACEKGDIAKDFTSRVDSILKNHIGVGVKTLKIVVYNHYNVDANHFNSWLQSAITPGIEEITLFLPTNYRDGYNFPCSVLLNGHGNSIRYLHLTYCAFRPMVGFDCLSRLTKLHLYQVRITGNELGCLISKSFALEQLELMSCDELICLKIPLCLERLSCLRVTWCKMLKTSFHCATFGNSYDIFDCL